MSAPANQRPLTKEELLQARELFEKVISFPFKIFALILKRI
jgi:hypothetical protein